MSDYDLIPVFLHKNYTGQVRITQKPLEGYHRISVRDIIAVVCQENQNRSAEIWRTLNPKVHAELEPYKVDHKFKGKGQQVQPVLNLTGILKLILMLPGKNATLFKGSVAQILVNYLAKTEDQLIPGFQLDQNQQVLLREMAQSECVTDVKTEKQFSVDENEGKDFSRDSDCQQALVPFTGEFDIISARWESEDRNTCKAVQDEKIFGYCYVAWNPSLPPQLHKIGASFRSPIFRIQELSRTSVPEPFQLIASFQCFNPFEMEKRIHARFASSRKYGRRNEFFEAPRSEILAFFDKMASESLVMVPIHSGKTSRSKKRALSGENKELRDEVMSIRKHLQEQGKMIEKLLESSLQPKQA